MDTDYTRILQTGRMRESTIPGRDLLMEAESDRGRILFSPAFRRLQQKAQVFSMEPNAAVRSRLTHSFEVSQIGRHIATKVGAKLLAAGCLSDQSLIPPLVNFVENACLMHDIGNPPFGHFGEAAIRTWFSDHGAACLQAALGTLTDDSLLKPALADFVEFDGNPQGLRIVTKLQWNNDEFGLNLTKTTLASYMKYIRMAGQAKDSGSKFLKKAGYFSTEAELVHAMWQAFEYSPDVPQRFPLAYIMEAADDIAYCISDLEDSIEKGLVQQQATLKTIQNQWLAEVAGDSDPWVSRISAVLQKIDDANFTYTNFRTSLNNIFAEFAAEQYIQQHPAILDGSCDALLPDSSAAGKILKLLKDFCQKNVYCHDSVQRVELAGYAAICGILHHFEKLLKCKAERFNAALSAARQDEAGVVIVFESKILQLFPEKYKKVYQYDLALLQQQTASGLMNDKQFRAKEWTIRAHLIVDFLSGMTDDFAMTTYRMLSGMQV